MDVDLADVDLADVNRASGRTAATIYRVWSRMTGRRRVMMVQPHRKGIRPPLFGVVTDVKTEAGRIDDQRLSLRVAIPLLVVMAALAWTVVIDIALRVF